MIKLNEAEYKENLNGALALRPTIESIVDEVFPWVERLCWIGIGGTWASAMQATFHMKEYTDVEVFATNAAEFNTTGDKRINDKTLAVFSSVSGTTGEVVTAVEKLHAQGAKVLGFVDAEGTPLAELADWCISFPKNEQLKFFMVADRFLNLLGVFPDYEEYYGQLEAHLADDLIKVEEAADAFGKEYAEKHMNDRIHYFVGAGANYGATYSYAMCYWEEMHWIRTKSIHAAEFFHGMLEIIDSDTAVTVFVGEDSQRPLSLRVKNFLDKINENHTVIDSSEYPMEGIDDKYRNSISHHILHAVTNRIDAHLEALSGHDMNLRRYYRKVEY